MNDEIELLQMYYGQLDEKNFSEIINFGRMTGFGLNDGFSTFYDYDKARKMSEYLEEYHEYLKNIHGGDDEPPKTFIKK